MPVEYHEDPDPNEDEFDEEAPTPPLPPDGGWGWMVVAASLMCNIIVDGVCFSFGIFLVDFVQAFGETRQKTAWVGSLIPGLYLGMGPVASALANKYGIREVTILGSIIAAASFFASTFSPSVDVLIFLYGIMGGFGFGLMYLPAIIIVNFYFEKKRAFATGIAVCGSGIGTFIFAPFSQFLLDNYGWRGSYWIISGIILNGVVCGLIFRPLEAQVPKPKKKAKEMKEMRDPPKSRIMQTIIDEKNRQRTISTGSLDGSVITKDNKLVKDPKVIRQMSLLAKLDEEKPAGGLGSEPNLSFSSQTSQYGNGTAAHATTTVDDSSSSSHRDRSISSVSARNKYIERLKSSSTNRLRTTSEGSEKSSIVWRRADSISRLEQQKEIARPMYRADIFYSGSVTSLAEYQSECGGDRESYVASVMSIPDVGDEGSCQRMCAPACHVLREMFDFRLLRSPTFFLLCMASILGMSGFFTPFVYVTSLALELGISTTKASYLVSVIGLTNTIFRIICGWICDQPWADCLLIHNVALIIGGVCTCLVPFFTSFPLLAVYCGIFGSCIAAYISLRTIVLVDLLGIHKLNNSFGLLLLFQGVASLIGSPAAGAIFDATQSYSASFVTSGATIALAGFICLPIRMISRWERRREMAAAGSNPEVEPLGSIYTRINMDEHADDATI